jgi:hypothetical protein
MDTREHWYSDSFKWRDVAVHGRYCDIGRLVRIRVFQVPAELAGPTLRLGSWIAECQGNHRLNLPSMWDAEREAFQMAAYSIAMSVQEFRRITGKNPSSRYKHE